MRIVLKIIGNYRRIRKGKKYMSKKQAMNPYLPLWEYVPDGEPRVFGDRLYVYGSHDGNIYAQRGSHSLILQQC